MRKRWKKSKPVGSKQIRIGDHDMTVKLSPATSEVNKVTVTGGIVEMRIKRVDSRTSAEADAKALGALEDVDEAVDEAVGEAVVITGIELTSDEMGEMSSMDFIPITFEFFFGSI